jgi:hypothetical protein
VTLDNTDITNAGLEHLKGLPNLRSLNLHKTKVTEEGLRQLREALPKCRITTDAPYYRVFVYDEP